LLCHSVAPTRFASLDPQSLWKLIYYLLLRVAPTAQLLTDAVCMFMPALAVIRRRHKWVTITMAPLILGPKLSTGSPLQMAPLTSLTVSVLGRPSTMEKPSLFMPAMEAELPVVCWVLVVLMMMAPKMGTPSWISLQGLPITPHLPPLRPSMGWPIL